MKIVLPKTLCNIDPTYGPLFFLAGPIRGGDDWQAACCEEIKKYFSRFYVAIPCRYGEDHHLYQYRMPGEDGQFDRQTTWERLYLTLAATKGCLIFWLPLESKTRPRDDGQPYARDTYGELGEWRGRMMSDKDLRIVVGAEADFPGLSQIQCNFNEALGTDFPIYPTLAETVAAAIAKVQ